MRSCWTVSLTAGKVYELGLALQAVARLEPIYIVGERRQEAGWMGNRGVVEHFKRAMETDDFDTQDALIHEDYVLDLPQSGERIRGRANRRAMIEQYPGRVETEMKPLVGRIIGRDDQFVTSPFPAWNIIHLAGSGDEFQTTGTIRYPDGKLWHFVALMTLREGKIWREVDYFAEPFDPPAWRSQYVEPIDP